MTLEEAIDHYYAKGQGDYPDWDPPMDDDGIHIVAEFFGGTSSFDRAVQKAYREGWNHAKDQAGD